MSLLDTITELYSMFYESIGSAVTSDHVIHSLVAIHTLAACNLGRIGQKPEVDRGGGTGP